MNESFKNSEFILDVTHSVGDIIYNVYNQGYEDGLKDGKESVQIDESTAYERGLEDAWDLARKLSKLGFNDKRQEIFGKKYGLSIDIIKDFSVDEVEAKIEEYEKKQKQAEIWLSHRNLQMISIETLAKALKIDEEELNERKTKS